MSERIELHELTKARTELTTAGVDIAILSSVANVTYVSGVEVPIPVGAGAELTFAPWLAVISAAGGGAGLVVPGGAAKVSEVFGYERFEFEGFDSFHLTDPGGTYASQLLSALKQAGATGATGTLGVETRSLPLVAARAIQHALPGWALVDCEAAIRLARLIKTAREISILRRTSALADISHNTLATLCRTAGQSEFEMFAEISKNIFAGAGHDIPLSGELVTGPRTNVVAYPGGPRNRITAPGDAALMDLSGRFDGYWFDCTNTHVIGEVEPTMEQIRYARASQAACEAGMGALRPGAYAHDASAAAAAAFATFGLPNAHYTGHQIGVTVNELPRLVPYDHTPIQSGMVFCVEPGAYQGPEGAFGARSEKMVLVTDSGPEVLSTFSWGI